MPIRLRIALVLAALCHGVLMIAGRYRLSYDVYTHLFFADHYLHNWGSLWDKRWYAGFTVTSYPPLVHQVMALLAVVSGVEAAYALILFIVVVALPAAVYAFARVFLEPESAGNAAIGAAVLPSIYLSAHVFGQLPTLTALLLALFALATLAGFLRSGNRIKGALTIALLAAVVASHHATLLFLPFGIAAVVGHMLINRLIQIRLLLWRLFMAGLPAALACLVVIWPFWVWGTGQTLQTPIDHLSRHNFVDDPGAFLFFFVPMYGLMVGLIPYVIWQMTRRELWAPAIAFIVLFVLGLGGTTPLPRLLFGAGWEWLTYDRFSLWASVILLIFFGKVVAIGWARSSRELSVIWSRRIAGAVGLGLLAIAAFGAALFPIWFPTQPPQVDMQPIAAYLNRGDHAQWRFLAFGFGDQWAALSLVTTAATIDGSYHTARQLPILRASGIGQIDSIFWSDKGLDALGPILQSSNAHSVRWGFVDRREYEPALVRQGWIYDQMLSNDIAVWENPNAGPAVVTVLPPDDPLQLFTWQFAPLTALVLAGILAVGHIRPARIRRVLLHVHTGAIGLIPLGLSIWVYRDLIPISYSRIYFSYTDVLLFASDGLIIIAVIAWGLSKWLQPDQLGRRQSSFLIKASPVVWLTRLLFGLCVLATFSAVWSVDARLSLATSAHLWLLFVFFCSLKDHPVSLAVLVLGASVALLIQAGISYTEVILQTTAFLSPLSMMWPGEITPAVRGASVVQLADGTRWLRAYGSFPHPNILGAWASVALAAPAAWFLMKDRLRLPAAVVVITSVALIFLAFSRSAWLGCIAAAVVVVLHRRHFSGRRLLVLGIIMLVGLSVVVIPLSRMVFTRVAGFDVPTEQQSIEVRTWMVDHALMMIREHPFLGVGIGGYVVELVNRNPGEFLLEPAHNILLLAAGELGIPGVLILVATLVTLFIGVVRAKHPLAVIAAAMIVCVMSAAVFDHFLWTLAPERSLLWFVLGIWAGWQIPREACEARADFQAII